MKLAPHGRRERFVEEYLVDMNASAAARRAGYSEKSCYSQGARLLRDARIVAAIEAARRQRSEATGITAERVLQELAKIAFLDPRLLFDADGHLIPLVDLDDERAAVIAGLEVSVSTDEDGTVTRIAKIKIADKLGALDKLGKHLGLFEPKNQPGSAENPIQLLIKHAQGTALPVVAEPPADDEDGED